MNPAQVPEGTMAPVDLVLVIDRSGSMNAETGVDTVFGDTRIALARATALALIQNSNAQNVLIVDFASDADNTGWLTKQAAIDFISAGGDDNNGYGANFGDNSGTNYDAALFANEPGTANDGVAQALTVAKPNPVPPGTQTFGYFLSDGEPNEGTEIGGTDETNWINALMTNGVSRVFAVGMGTGVGAADIADLEPVAWQPGETAGTNTTSNSNVKIIDSADFSSLISTLVSFLPGATSGNLLSNDQFGADGPGRLVSIRLDSDGDGTIEATDDLYTYDVAGSDILKNGAAWAPGNNTSELSVTTANGGTFKLDFVDPDGAGSGQAGDWEYSTPNTDIVTALTDKFRYTMQDDDGDGATGDLAITITPKNAAPAGATSELAVNEDFDDDHHGGAVWLHRSGQFAGQQLARGCPDRKDRRRHVLLEQRRHQHIPGHGHPGTTQCEPADLRACRECQRQRLRDFVVPGP